MTEGRIVKVSGPLVVAQNLPDVKMYDVVKVGQPHLIGEVVGLEEELAYIQVYEETSGIGPDEPVVSTGEPLSVELGPGLIGAIYDGIQRPLNIIREKSGNWIARGIEVPKIDRQKKWEFKPLRKKGDKVGVGDIIGTVQETELIVHKIMVPQDLEGEIVSIKEGKFSVEETVCQVKQNGQIRYIKMIQHWPVRKERPVKEKLPPVQTLVTGQRVIDTFFPVTKGGTACIPGPFGSGKCVSGDTPVLLGNGELLAIKDIFERYKDQGEKIIKQDEEYTILNKPLVVFTYQNGNIAPQRVRAVYKGKTDKIFIIKTRTGRIAKVTPIHKLFKIDGGLNIKETKAMDLKMGDYLITPRILEIPTNWQDITDTFLEAEYRVNPELFSPPVKEVIDELAKKYGTKKILAKKLGISYDVLIGYYLGKNKPTVEFINKLYKLAHYHIPEYKNLKGQRQSKEIKIPKIIDKNFAAFLGLQYSDGSIKKNSLRFYNNDSAILNLYRDLSIKLFGLNTKLIQMKTVKAQFIENKIVADVMKKLGYPEYEKSKHCYAPIKLMTSPTEVIGAFLGAYFICDGYFNTEKGEIEIVTASSTMARDLVYLTLRVGILTRFREKIYKNRVYYRIMITGREQLEKFFKHCNIGDYEKLKKIKIYLDKAKRNYSCIDIVPIGAEKIKEIYIQHNIPYQKLKDVGVEIHNYLRGELMGKKVFTNFARQLKIEEMEHFALNHLEHIYCDEIVEIQEISVAENVYDLEVPQGHNFIGGIAPMIYHNTVVQHQLAKWADADIIVYVGCGERGNEMTDVLMEFPHLKDPRSGEPLIKRTVLIANTSNMPVSAREASVYTGITIAEYFRDMGYNVALMADSTSRWAEALREMSGRLEEMPGEEGYPAYLSMRIAEFYERAGRAICIASDKREGTLSVIGAVSPPGGDLSDPVVQATLRVVKVFWSLEDRLAYMRHFPAINWLNSYSLYLDNIRDFVNKKISPEFLHLRREAIKILQDEASLEEIVRLVGIEALSPGDRLTLATAKSIREDFLHQYAFDPEDTYTSLPKQYLLLKLIMNLHWLTKEAINRGENLEEFLKLKIREKISRAKYIPENKLDKFNELIEEIDSVFKSP